MKMTTPINMEVAMAWRKDCSLMEMMWLLRWMIADYVRSGCSLALYSADDEIRVLGRLCYELLSPFQIIWFGFVKIRMYLYLFSV